VPEDIKGEMRGSAVWQYAGGGDGDGVKRKECIQTALPSRDGSNADKTMRIKIKTAIVCGVVIVVKK
jgi:hypothetical protein